VEAATKSGRGRLGFDTTLILSIFGWWCGIQLWLFLRDRWLLHRRSRCGVAGSVGSDKVICQLDEAGIFDSIDFSLAVKPAPDDFFPFLKIALTFKRQEGLGSRGDGSSIAIFKTEGLEGHRARLDKTSMEAEECKQVGSSGHGGCLGSGDSISNGFFDTLRFLCLGSCSALCLFVFQSLDRLFHVLKFTCGSLKNRESRDEPFLILIQICGFLRSIWRHPLQFLVYGAISFLDDLKDGTYLLPVCVFRMDNQVISNQARFNLLGVRCLVHESCSVCIRNERSGRGDGSARSCSSSTLAFLFAACLADRIGGRGTGDNTRLSCSVGHFLM
jgi:hypothetical protein